MSSEKAKSTIVIKRIKKGGHAGHGAAWKIAYADFVTAMMAFFLLMWLLGSTTKGDLKGIADYFQSPLQVALSGGSGAGDATSLIQGGGPLITETVGQRKMGDNDSKKMTPYQMRKELARAERARMDRLKERIDAAILANAKLAEYRNQIRVEITPDGLRIQIVDDFNRPMFALGSSLVQPYMRDILQAIGQLLNEVDAKVTLSGHTDGAPYAGGERGYSNWELSADRANASRRELVAGGLELGKILRVVGLADSSLLLKDEPRSALNRRISIIVLNKLAEEKMSKANGEIEAGTVDEFEQGLHGEPGTATPTPTPAGADQQAATPAAGAPAAAATQAAAAPAAAAVADTTAASAMQAAVLR